MADTIREQIIKAFTAKAQSLSTKEVERVRRSQPEGAERNVSIWDADDAAIDKEFGIQNCSFQIGVHLQWQFLTDNPSVLANALMGEVVHTMLAGDITFGGLATGVEYTRANPEYPEDGSKYVALTVLFTIYYSTVVGDPFTLPA